MTCPRCGSLEVRPILYGLPTIEAAREEQDGRIVLGGCEPKVEDLACRRCGLRFCR